MSLQKQKGFTIIEVVLVLAIAGLIFLMVFIALPTLQRNQRDTTRRNDISRFKAQLNQYQANNKGSVPTAGCTATSGFTGTSAADFVGRYMGDDFKDPSSGNSYSCATSAISASSVTGSWYYAPAMKCSGEGMVQNTGARNYAVQMKLEGSGIVCMDNL